MTTSITLDESVIRTDERLTALENAVTHMDNTLQEILAKIAIVQEAVEPALAGLSASPIGKMLGI